MELHALHNALDMARRKHELTDDDVAVLQQVAAAQAAGEATTVMKTVEHPYVVSPATIHARVKRLCERGFLIKTEQKSNMRYKILMLGPKATDFIDELKMI